MGKQPVKLTVGSLKYANDVAKYYEADHPADSFINGNVDGSHFGHDTKAINKALVENGIKPGMGGRKPPTMTPIMTVILMAVLDHLALKTWTI
ncbi:hypothetical protein [Lactobacillus taiwanensis]|uniref:hypothetical protein n=1 Tax=Lactobacillus taiwanensis TaxID=508451 RepID=UPI0021C34ED9|nr:hypothetical protein [Lactobacillus taiwanensis]